MSSDCKGIFCYWFISRKIVFSCWSCVSEMLESKWPLLGESLGTLKMTVARLIPFVCKTLHFTKAAVFHGICPGFFPRDINRWPHPSNSRPTYQHSFPCKIFVMRFLPRAAAADWGLHITVSLPIRLSYL